MTTKYESVLSEEDLSEIAIKNAMKSGTPESLSRRQWEDDSDIRETFICLLRDAEQAVLAKLQPQLDAIGAGGVSGQRVTKPLDVESIHLKDLKNAVAQNKELHQRINLMEEYVKGECWLWQGDRKDDLDSMGNRMGILIYACDLRNLLARNQTPEGYKLVPIVPTREMKRAGYEHCADTQRIAGEIYSAMLAVAPTPDIKDSLTPENQEIRIVFSGEMPSLTFVEVENEDGFSVNAGEWHKRFDGYTELRIKVAKE